MPNDASTRVSVVVCTRDRPALLERCLAALTACSSSPFETIVVDNAPASYPAEAIALRYGARYIMERRVGLSRARNAGTLAARGDIVAFVDDDAAPAADWLSAIARAFGDSTVGVVAGEIVAVGPELDATAYRVGERRVVRRTHPRWFEITSFGGVGNGANMSFRREALAQIGGFDERLGLGAPLPGFEEHDAFARMVEAGHAAVSDPGVIVFHDGRARDPRRRATAQYSIAFPYFVFLLMEKRAYRARIVRYLLEGLFGKRRQWRRPTETPLLTRRERFAAMMAAPRLVWGAVVRSLDSATPASFLQ